MEAVKKVDLKHKASRSNAQKRTNNVKSLEFKNSKSDAKKAFNSFVDSIAELILAISAIVKFVARDVWAKFGKLIKSIAQKLNKAGNHMDWSEK